jgi:hypothetical protein
VRASQEHVQHKHLHSASDFILSLYNPHTSMFMIISEMFTYVDLQLSLQKQSLSMNFLLWKMQMVGWHEFSALSVDLT